MNIEKGQARKSEGKKKGVLGRGHFRSKGLRTSLVRELLWPKLRKQKRLIGDETSKIIKGHTTKSLMSNGEEFGLYVKYTGKPLGNFNLVSKIISFMF